MHGKSLIATRALTVACMSVLMIFASCSKEEALFEKAPFTVNPEMVADALVIPELDLEFAPPAGWTTLDSVQLDQFRRMLGGTELSREFYPLFPLVVYIDSVSGCMMYIAQIEEAEVEMPVIAQRYNDFLDPRMTSSAVTKANYIVNDLNIYYYLTHSTDVVNYKLIGETTPGKRFLIEYVVGGVVYAQLEPFVSSSLASIKSSSGTAGQ